jgi:DNA helicase-2/ATP-dependent DNA helicase PcrA
MTFNEFKSQFNINLNPQQEAAVQAIDGPVLLLAVPGSGKTTVLVTRLGYMLYARDIRPERILTMTYTVAATRDMRERFTSMFGNELADKLEFRTINGLSSTIIRHYERTLRRKAFDLLDDTGKQAAIIGEIYRQKAEDFATESAIKTIQTAITYTKNMMLSDNEIEALEPEGIKFAPMYHEYCRVLKNRNLMDFDDQMVYAHQILRRYPDILCHFQKKFSYFSVDEAQDTSRIQHEIIRLLALESGNLFMVGDEDQSIYGFRAAYPEALMEFEQVYPGAKILLMEENYRSTQQIVSTADKFIRQNINRHPKRMTAVCGNGKDVSEISVNDRRGQYRYLLAVAKDCKTETAVLYRDNDSALPVIDLLDRAGISYRCRQVDSTFFSHWVIRDITDIIRFASNPFDSEVFLRIYYKLGAGISKTVAEASVKKSAKKKCPILECLIEHSGISSWTKKQSKALQTHFTNLISEPADRAVYRIVNFMGYGDYLKDRGSDQNKAQILEALGASEPTPDRLLERLDELCEVVKAGSTNSECNFILSTIHSSKGLEYDRVILMDVVDGILPKMAAPAKDGTAEPEEVAAYEEERRLFYVGMTRAKKELSIFRFRKAELCSAFAKAVFPDKAPTPKRSGTHKSAINTVRITPVSEGIKWIAKDYIPGSRVSHKSFGPGRLTVKDDDIITVRFDDGTQKRFSLSAALQKDLFSLL